MIDINHTPGNLLGTLEAGGADRISSNPAAASSGPTVIGMRAPCRCDHCPARDDNASISTVTMANRNARKVSGST